MPTETITAVSGFAHCTRPRCPGHEQEQVAAESIETSYSFTENGGDLPGIERSHVNLRFANEEDAPCRHCGRRRDLSDSPRRIFDGSLSGHDPMGLLDIEVGPNGTRFDPKKQAEVAAQPMSDEERETMRSAQTALEAQNAMLMERLAALEAAQPEADK